jgi:hypothetical protein
MFYGRLKFLLIFAVIFFSAFFCWSSVESADQNINVIMTVPKANSSPPPPPPADNTPIISNIVSTTSYTTAKINWSASDDKAISTSSFEYGTTISYGSIGTITGSYQVDLTGLTTNTIYYFKITVTDSKPQSTVSTSIFRTLSETTLIDITPPIISNIQVLVGITTTTISWATNEDADGQIGYGISNLYGSTISNATKQKTQSLFLLNLLPNTTYHYRIITTDNAGNSASTADALFTTLQDNIAPPDVSNFKITTTSNSIILNWSNPSLLAIPDFKNVKVLRKAYSFSGNPNDGTIVYTGTATNYTDTNFSYSILYFYTIFSYDTSGNSSNGSYQSIIIYPSILPSEVCNNGLDDDGDSGIDCVDTDCASQVCKLSGSICSNKVCIELICNDKIDNDTDGAMDCVDTDCTNSSACQTTPKSKTAEVCNNGLDDDGDGDIDCKDSDCVGFSDCKILPPQNSSSQPACSDGVDNDSDGLIDFLKDPGCENAVDNDEYNPPVKTVIGLSLSDIIFIGGNGTVQLTPINSVVSGLAGSDLAVRVPVNKLLSTPKTIVIKVGGVDQHALALDSSKQNYFSILTFPNISESQAYLEIDYDNGKLDSVGFKLSSQSFGDILGNKNERLSGTNIILYQQNGEKMLMQNYGQSNPYIVGINGNYGWMAPNGYYYLVISKDGYYDRTTPVFKIDNNVINSSWNLIAKPKKIAEVIDSNASIGKNIGNVAKNISDKAFAATQVGLQKMQQVADNPKVEKTTEQVVVPSAVGVVAIGVIPFLTWADILPLLRLLFLQPLMLLGWNKKKKWGVIYNTLNKLPIDLAIVRLISAKDDRVIQSKVTDRLGRYAFITDPGEYKIEVRKAGLLFPSVLMAGFFSDGRRTDIYHGELIRVTEKRVIITANIPLDPEGENKKLTRLIWQRLGRGLQTGLSIAGIIITVVSLYISPKLFIAILLAVHITLFLLFRRLSKSTKVKSWGIVYDEADKTPVGRTVARLFNSRFNKLVASQITDRKGRYQFLAGDDQYYVTYEKQGYNPFRKDVDLKGREAEVVDEDVGLEKGESSE